MKENYLKKILHTLIDAKSFLRKESDYRKGYCVLMYHALGSQAYQDPNGNHSINPKLFQRHMEYIKTQNNFEIDQLINIKKNLHKNKIAVTFDDGYKDNLLKGLPILQKLNIPFTIFVSTQFVKDKNTNFLSKNDIRFLSNIKGVTIGSHGENHVPFTDLTKGQLNRELLESKKFLEDLVGKEIELLAYPFGKTNEDIKNRSEQAGYKVCFGTIFGRNIPNADLKEIKRIDILKNDNKRRFVNKVKGDWDCYSIWQRARNL